MNFKRYHVSRNLFDGQLQQGYYTYYNGVYVLSDAYVCTHLIPCTDNTTYTFRCINTGGGSKNYGYVFFDSSQNRIGDDYINAFTEGDVVTHTATTPQNTAFLAINIAYGRRQASVIRPSDITDFMLNTGSTALPYEPYSSEVWHDSHYIMGTSTDTITTLPVDIYADGNNATVGLKGNTVQNGTPAPQNPIQPQECGDLEAIGEKAGQYKIPILSANTTTPVYLGEVETTRRIKKYVFDGTENWAKGDYPPSGSYQFGIPKNVYFPDAKSTISNGETFCTHFINRQIAGGIAWGINFNIYMLISDLPEDATADDFKAFLAAQYAAGTPVTIWYVLANPETAVVNEPIRKIGDYADTVSGITVPTITGKDTFDVETTLKPSEVTANYHGWHPVQSVHEAVQSNNLFNPEHHITIENLDYIGDVYPANKYRVNNVSNFPCYYKIGESGTTATINPPANVYLNASDVVYIWCSVNSNRKIGVTEGSTPLPYEPYGIIWNP